jgi:iron complex transport system substrate-binding protein
MKNGNMRAWLAIIAIIMMLTFILAGCGSKFVQEQPAGQSQLVGQETTKDAAASTQAATIAAAGSTTQTTMDGTGASQKFPMKVTDAGGLDMTIASEPQRVVSLTLGSDEMLLGLLDKSRIIALTKYADDAGISNVSSEAAGVQERVVSDKIEGIIALKPDMVILDTWADPKGIKQLRDAGITVYTFKTPTNIDEQKAVILELASITGTEGKGREIVDWMDSKLKDIEGRLSKLKPEEKLTVMDYGEMGSSGKGTNFDDIVTRAGLINVVSRAGMDGWPTVTKEKMIEMNPDIIILPSWYYDQKNSLKGMTDTLKKDKSLQTVKAISGDKLISVPNPHVSAISQYVVLGVEDVAKAAYPELFK